MGDLSCAMWDLAPCSGIEPLCLALGSWSLSHWNQGSPQASGLTCQHYFCLPQFPLGSTPSQGSVASLPPIMVFLLSLWLFLCKFFQGPVPLPQLAMRVCLMSHYTLFSAPLTCIFSPGNFIHSLGISYPVKFWQTLYTTSLQRLLLVWFWIARETLEFHSWVPKSGSSPFPDVGIISDLSSLTCCHLRTCTVCSWRRFAATLCFPPLRFFVILALNDPIHHFSPTSPL